MPAASRRAAYGGLAAALVLLALLAVHLSPTADLALYAFASLCMAAVLLETGPWNAALAWLAATGIALFYPGFQVAVPFGLFFGPWPLAKAAIERRVPRKIGLAVKAGLFSVVLAAGYGFYTWIDDLPQVPDTLTSLPLAVAGLLALAVLLVYDYALTLLIHLYISRIRPGLR